MMQGVNDKPLVSILVPVFNEEDNIRPLYEALVPVMAGLDERYRFEVLFTDNHSTDRTFALLTELAANDERIRALRFSRNFGFQRSIHAGYVHARGDVAIQIDCDLQDPPEMIATFLDKWREGHDVVYGVRRSRKEGLWITWLRRLFYRLIDALTEDDLPHDAGDFRLVSRRVIEPLKAMDDYHPYLRGAIASLGFRQIGVPYDRDRRQRGESKFSFGQLVSLAIDGILNHSVVPLRMATLTGLAISALTFLGIVGYVIGKVAFGQDWPAGFATLTVLILLTLSLNALFLGVIGEYLGRIYQQVKRRPLTVIESRLNCDDDKTA